MDRQREGRVVIYDYPDYGQKNTQAGRTGEQADTKTGWHTVRQTCRHRVIQTSRHSERQIARYTEIE